MIKIEAIIKRSLRWYFTKNALPYWCMLLMDSAIIVGAGLCIYWILNRTQSIFDNRIEVLYSLLVYTLVSWIGARLFHTYQVHRSDASGLCQWPLTHPLAGAVSAVRILSDHDIYGSEPDGNCPDLLLCHPRHVGCQNPGEDGV